MPNTPLLQDIPYQKKFLNAVWHYKDKELEALLANITVAQKQEILTLLCNKKDEGLVNANILQVALYKRNKVATLRLVKLFVDVPDFIRTTERFVPPIVFAGFMAYVAAPEESEEKLIKLIDLYTLKDTLTQRIQQIENEEKLMAEAADWHILERIQVFIPESYTRYARRPDYVPPLEEIQKLEFIWKQKIKHLGHRKDYLYSYILFINGHLNDIDGLYIHSFGLKTLLENRKADFLTGTVVPKVVNPDAFAALERMAKAYFDDDIALTTQHVDLLKECLSSEFKVGLEYLICEYVTESRNVIWTANTKYVEDLHGIIASITFALKAIAEKAIAGNIVHAQNIIAIASHNFVVLVESINRAIVDFAARYSALAKKNHSAEEIIKEFYTIVPFKPILLDLLERVLHHQLRLSQELEKASQEQARPAATGTMSEVVFTTAQTTTVSRQQTERIEEDKKFALENATTSLSLLEPTRRPKAHFDRTSEQFALTPEEYRALQELKLEQYKKDIEEYRAGKAAESRQKILRTELLQVVNADIDFSEQFEAFLADGHTIAKNLAPRLEAFLQRDEQTITHDELQPLLTELGFNSKPTTKGFLVSYGRFTLSYHRGHEKTGGSTLVHPKAISKLMTAIKTNELLPKLKHRMSG